MNEHKKGLREIWFLGEGNTATKAFLWLRKHDPRLDILVCSTSDGVLAPAVQGSGARWFSLNDPTWRILRGSPTLVVSFLLPYHIPLSLISQSQYGGLNFHPAPLPYFRGVRCATFAILKNAHIFGVTCHYMTERLDDGPILAEEPVPILPNDTAHSLETRSKKALLNLFIKVLSNRTWESSPPNTCEYLPPGKLFTQELFDRMACIEKIDNCDLDLYTRAFWNPPYSAAYIERQHRRVFLVPQDKLLPNLFQRRI